MAYSPLNPNGQATMANSSPVVIASNQSAIPVTDNSGSITIDAVSLPLPTGAATSDRQDTGNASLASIDAKLTNPLPVSASSLPLPSGAATSANQTTIIGHVDGIEGLLTTIDADTSALAGAVSGTEVQVDIVSSALPSGAATAALQTQPGVDIGDVTINNASGGSAVNIQDGGNSITVDGTVTANAGSGFPTLSIVEAISATAFALGGAPYSATSSITEDYILDHIQFNFSTTQSRDITITAADGTKLWSVTGDTSQHITLEDIDKAFNTNSNFTIAVTQTGGACAMDVLATVRQGAASLGGTPSITQSVTADANNSSTTNLAAGNSYTFTGTASSTLGVAGIQVTLKTDVDCTVYVDQSPDGSNWDIIDSYSYIATRGNFGITVQAVNSYVRVRVTSASLTSTYFRLQTALCPIVDVVPRSLDALGFLRVTSFPWGVQAAAGLVPNIITVSKFGRNPDVDVGTEDIWSQGGTWVAPTTARVHNIKSSSANDTSAGTGARTITVNGLNGSYVDTTETVTMNGTSDVATINSYVIIHRMVVATAGSGATNAGTITATAQTDATISSAIVIGKGQTQMAFYQIPTGYTGYLSSYGGSMNGGSSANVDLELFAKPFGGVFNLKGTINLSESGGNAFRRVYDTPLKFAAKTLIKVTATSDAVNSNVSANFDILLLAD